MRFEILSGPEDGEIKEKMADEITLGRGVENDIFFTYAGKVSGRHASIIKEGDDYYLIDQGNDREGSRNGTVVLKRVGEKIEIWKEKKDPPFPGDKIPIEPDDVVILGRSIWFKFLGE